jgi:predicted metal-dependent hydrolase
VPVRRVDLEDEFATVPKHFAKDGDLLSSHLAAALSSMFPDGEVFFINSVKHYRSRITDPELADQVSGFIGQEVVHGREHRAFNDHLAKLGYPTKRFERLTAKGLQFRTRHLPPIANLASTAALEHFTATFAEVVLRNPELQDAFGHEAVRDLFVWHALEESEHKAVAFDVYRAVGGGERLRILTMKMVRYAFVVSTTLQVLVSLLGDPAARRPGAVRRSWQVMKRNPLLSRATWEQLKVYERVGFHPNDIPTEELVAQWREKLFGASGEMLYAVSSGR